MHNRKPPPDKLLFRAAEARAAGNSWAAIGLLVGRSQRTVCKWPKTYSERWDAALRAADREAIELAAAHAVVTLKNLLHSENERIRAKVAWRLIYQRLEQWKIDIKLFLRESAGNENRDDPNTQSVRSLDRDKLILLLAQMRTTPLAGIDGDRSLPPARAG